MNKNPKQEPAPKPEVSEYEKKVKAISLAISHSRNCHSETLIKLANSIYDFINGKKSVKAD